MKGLLHIIIASVILLMAGSCVSEEWLSVEEEREVAVSFSVSLDSGIETRSIADATVDRLVIVAKDIRSGEYKELYDGDLSSELSFSLISGRKYEFLFWAQYSDSRAYRIKDGVVTIDYEADLGGGRTYLDSGFAGMKELDAFYVVETVEVGKVRSVEVKLTRPVAQLNFADPKEAPLPESIVTVSLRGVATTFNPFSGEYGSVGNKEFIFNDFPSERLSSGDESYNHLASIFLFPVSGVSADYRMTDQESKEGISVSLEANRRTNVIGYFVQAPAPLSVWDGITLTIPSLDSENRYVIDEASDLAWLQDNGAGLEKNSTFIVASDMDMDGHQISSLQLPEGSVIEGSGRTIRNANASGALFGSVSDISVKDLAIRKFTVSSASHTGILVNTLYGNGTFSNVRIDNSSVTTTGGAAGGFVGFIVRKSEKDQSEMLTVTFDKCSIKTVSISGSASEGYFVGLLNGYDNGEKLVFASSCAKDDDCTLADYTSLYSEGSEASWVADTDFSEYDGWLGAENYLRAKVYYGDETSANRFVRKWDGETKVEPIAISGGKAIYSVFDLASCAGTSPGKLEFHADVDYAGHIVTPVTILGSLAGNNHSIYNLYVETSWDNSLSYGGGFAIRCNNGTFRDITFVNPDVRVHHVADTEGDARAGILCADVMGGSCVMENIHVRGGYLFGVNKMGGIAGYIPATTFTASNCSVDGLSIENYNPGLEDQYGFTANGEIGGMFGFICSNATISGCWVKNTKLDCVGVNNGYVALIFKYSGRHINEFIGDIRTISAENIVITYTDSDFTGNAYGDFNGDGKGGREDHFSGCDKIGNCYYTDISIGSYGIQDKKGTLTVNGKSLTIPNGY